MVNNIIEKEIRGPLNNEIVKRIEQYAKEKNWIINNYRQISIYCNTDHIETIGSVEKGNARIIIDVRKEELTIKLKLGNALNFERKEYSIKCSKNSSMAIAILFDLLGIKEGFVRTFDRTDYISSNGVQLTIKLNCLMGDHFELERNSDKNDSIDEFNRIIKELDLPLWNKEELACAIRNDHNKVKAYNIISAMEEFI